jgi:hypothetical protein
MNPAHKPLSFIQSTQKSRLDIPWSCGAGRKADRGNREEESQADGNERLMMSVKALRGSQG